MNGCVIAKVRAKAPNSLKERNEEWAKFRIPGFTRPSKNDKSTNRIGRDVFDTDMSGIVILVGRCGQWWESRRGTSQGCGFSFSLPDDAESQLYWCVRPYS